MGPLGTLRSSEGTRGTLRLPKGPRRFWQPPEATQGDSEGRMGPKAGGRIIGCSIGILRGPLRLSGSEYRRGRVSEAVSFEPILPWAIGSPGVWPGGTQRQRPIQKARKSAVLNSQLFPVQCPERPGRRDLASLAGEDCRVHGPYAGSRHFDIFGHLPSVSDEQYTWGMLGARRELGVGMTQKL